MKINDNGVTRDMTPEEIAEMEREQANLPPSVPSDSDRLGKIETDISGMKDGISRILSILTKGAK